MYGQNVTQFIGGSRGALPAHPPTGSISFVFAYVFAEKCMRRRLAPLQRVGASPTGNSGSATAVESYDKMIQICYIFNT